MPCREKPGRKLTPWRKTREKPMDKERGMTWSYVINPTENLPSANV
jgi:hypothetical protein